MLQRLPVGEAHEGVPLRLGADVGEPLTESGRLGAQPVPHLDRVQDRLLAGNLRPLVEQ